MWIKFYAYIVFVLARICLMILSWVDFLVLASISCIIVLSWNDCNSSVFFLLIAEQIWLFLTWIIFKILSRIFFMVLPGIVFKVLSRIFLKVLPGEDIVLSLVYLMIPRVQVWSSGRPVWCIRGQCWQTGNMFLIR